MTYTSVTPPEPSKKNVRTIFLHKDDRPEEAKVALVSILVQELPYMTEAEAARLIGVAWVVKSVTLFTCHLEQAEVYVERLSEQGVTVSLSLRE